MLYTFSQANYDLNTLQDYLQNACKQDAIVLWQDGVLLPLKYPEIFEKCTALCCVLTQDVRARNLTAYYEMMPMIKSISLEELVEITAQHFPQVAL